MTLDWTNAWVFGGGPSAADVDTSRLSGGVVVGVNDAAFHKRCDVFFSNDAGYLLRIADKVRAYGTAGHLSLWPHQVDRFAGWPSRTWRRVESRWPSTLAGCVSSGPYAQLGCSGYVVLNLLAQMGTRDIVLFGYDFHDAYTYFFDSTPFPRKHVAGVRQSFRDVAPWYRERGIRIVNANTESAIDAFPRITHDEAYSMAA
jgi:hypothetical protein